MAKNPFETPVMSTADASMIREDVEDLKTIRDLHRASSRETDKRRDKLTTTIARALRRRYRDMVKRTGYTGNLSQWLNGKNMEDTYLHHSFFTRQYWSSRPIRISLRPDLNMFQVDSNNSWYYDLIGQKLSSDTYIVVAKRDVSNGQHRKNSPTILFESIPLPARTDSADA